MPRASDYKHRVGVMEATVTRDTLGAQKKQWTEAFTLHCGIEYEYRPTDNFTEVGNTQVFEARAWFTTRHTARVKMTHRLRYDGKDWEILTIMDQTGENKETKILVRETKP